MAYEGIACRLATVVAERSSRGARWGSCPSNAGEEHYANYLGPPHRPGKLAEPRIRDGWRGACEACGEPIPWKGTEPVYGSAGHQRVFDTPSGTLEPGCLFWVPDWGGYCHSRWTNCKGRHLWAMCPNGQTWDIDSRARNCGLPDDGKHRCWVRHGRPPKVHVDKEGRTCQAGAGSIVAGDYHGFLHDGAFTAG